MADDKDSNWQAKLGFGAGLTTLGLIAAGTTQLPRDVTTPIPHVQQIDKAEPPERTGPSSQIADLPVPKDFGKRLNTPQEPRKR